MNDLSNLLEKAIESEKIGQGGRNWLKWKHEDCSVPTFAANSHIANRDDK